MILHITCDSNLTHDRDIVKWWDHPIKLQKCMDLYLFQIVCYTNCSSS